MMHAGSLYLVGMMGAGKSTVGRLLARRLKLRFFDCDHEIERRCGVKIPLVFEIEGEAGFRAREAEAVAALTELGGIVLATGGGAVLDPVNRERLRSRGFVVYLHAQPRELWQRTRHDRTRPLLQNVDPRHRLEELYALRDPLYRETADAVVETGRQGVSLLVAQTLAKIEDACRLSA